MIDDEVPGTLSRSMQATLKTMICRVYAIGFMPDHVHVAVSIPPSLAIADVVGRLKGASSHAVNQEHPSTSFAWQAEYGVLSSGEKSLPDVVAYAENQKARHAESRLWNLAELADESGSRL